MPSLTKYWQVSRRILEGRTSWAWSLNRFGLHRKTLAKVGMGLRRRKTESTRVKRARFDSGTAK